MLLCITDSVQQLVFNKHVSLATLIVNKKLSLLTIHYCCMLYAHGVAYISRLSFHNTLALNRSNDFQGLNLQIRFVH